MFRRSVLVLGCLAGAFVVYATLCPIQDRPQTGHPDLERFGAFFLVSALFSIGLPRRRRVIGAAVVVAAFVLEAMQLLAPGRDAHLHDALVKAFGGIAALALTVWIDPAPDKS